MTMLTSKQYRDEALHRLHQAGLKNVDITLAGVQRLLGAADAMEQWENETEDLAEFAKDKDWPEARLLLVKYRMLTDLMARRFDLAESDEYESGYREALNDLRNELLRVPADDVLFGVEEEK